MYSLTIVLSLVILAVSSATAQRESAPVSTHELKVQKTTGKPLSTESTMLLPNRDTAAVDTTSLRARRMRAARQPRPGVFTSLDSARTMPDSVLVLLLRGKGLTALTGLASFKNLQVLDAAGNNLAAFPVDVLTLPKLTSLDLSDNPLKSIPAEIGSLKTLSRLNLRNTSISTLPPSIGACVALSSLDVSRNPLVSLPIKELNQLPLIRQFQIGGFKPEENPEPAKELEPAPSSAPAKKK